MAKILTVAHQKGGVGKSTLALNLAYAFQTKITTCVVDMDPQGTIASLKGAIGEGIPIITGITTKEIPSLPYQLIIIDTPPYNSDKIQDLFSMSDAVVIPTKAGIPDAMAIGSTVTLLRAAQLIKPSINAGIVINMVKPRSALTASVRKQLEKYKGIEVLAEIGDRVSYARSVVTGGVVAGEDSQAINEINLLTNKIAVLL